ncbi:DUF3325 domain-containing protein [Paenalcaligenes niemegkensis]|uniref:DUF3325 domain-containing protein n=1 Tax=Paenalcaligenes niemegkensis TaxID=2895469 RepID=UPI002150B16E|nr:DUF3325 domain-containing protein [Paenalcaligenes niemegkensis]MCQ9617541.1 DUF3325 domain-containing protein [Paenalcaligenes niemegkensis]
MSYICILLLCFMAFVCLALTMERHQDAVFERQLAPGMTKMLRTAGWFWLAVSLIVALRQPLWVEGLVAWFGCLSAGAALVFLLCC